MLLLTIKLIILLEFLVFINAEYKLTNLKCLEHDKQFATISQCTLKVVKRNLVAFDLYVKLHKIPVNNITVSKI